MTKTASPTRTSKAAKKKPRGKLPKSARNATGAAQPPDFNDRNYMLTMTEGEGVQVNEARCMLQLLEEFTFSGDRYINISRGALLVMVSAIKAKLDFKARLVSVDAAAGSLQDHGHM